VKFVIDAQLPAKLSRLLAEAGHDSVHTSQLPEGNRIPDATLAELADDEERVVVTKDRDFRNSHLLRRTELLALFAENLDTVVDALSEADYVELGPSGLIVHGDPTWTQFASFA